ncbi:unnamed protein product [Adineta ricciae]|uniref:MAM domain-containing protein n=1 Tax=Adineta ricciae TaxID=249248 RepID=A0A813SA58_ADIRI|nr:unnamed protein product [Adineta ricciae]
MLVLHGHAGLFHCDFETHCTDFDFDENGQLTNGSNISLIHYDHTLNDSSGTFLFFNSQSTVLSRIKTSDWIQPSFNQSVCFSMWYYPSHRHVSFDIQLVQGDDESLIRTMMSVTDNNQLSGNWIPVNVRLPAEKVKIVIVLNTTVGSLAIDDLSVHFCYEPQLPSSPQILFSCNGEWSCIYDFVPLINYPYQWSIIQAYNATQQNNQAPSIDHTFANQFGHYAWLEYSNSTVVQGNTGYLDTKTIFRISKNISYCLNFYYYAYGEFHSSNLNVFARLLETSNTVRQIWPRGGSAEYDYKHNEWTWATTQLPIGSYSLLFRVDSQSSDFGSFALDDIQVISCDYPFSEFATSPSLLSYSCNFDEPSQCEMANGFPNVHTEFNFTIFTGNTVPDRELGPIHDYTSNSPSGGFYYWNRQTNLSADDFGMFSPLRTIERNTDMCVRFAYYVKPSVVDEHETALMLDALECAKGNVWLKPVIDSQGWQFVVIRLQDYSCAEKFYFSVVVETTRKVAVAFDDIQFEQCSLIDIPYPGSSTTTSITTIKSTSELTTIKSTSELTTSSRAAWFEFSTELIFFSFLLSFYINK